MTENRKLKMKFAGRFIDLLGHQMYGGPVPAIAEFIANAWDADAPKVEVTVPENPKADDAFFMVRDYGEGMTFDEINMYYLHLGYERRKSRGEKTASRRSVMGRKGIGKLAGFGIAEEIIIRSVKDGRIVEFRLNYEILKSNDELNGFEFEPDIDEKTVEPSGVSIILNKLKLDRNINVDSFIKSIGRRFALKSDEMQISINGTVLSKEYLDFEKKIIGDDDNWIEDNIEGFGRVKYWFGFLNAPISDKELRGISIFARNRIAQFTPFFFNLTGGINGQVGLEYLTGQVQADTLDDEVDYIATDRQSINWHFGNAPVFEQWGQNKIKELCKDWKKRKDQKNLDKFKHNYSEFYPIIENLPEHEKRDLTSALEKIAGLERMEADDFSIIAKSMISGVQRESIKKVINKINTASEAALPALYEAISEWDIISAISTAEVVIGKIEIIKKFRSLIENRAPEKKAGQIDMQSFIKDHPWLLGHNYEHLQSADFHHEHGVDKWISDNISSTNEEYKGADERERRRFDLLCIKNDLFIVVLELMRPGVPADFDHAMRLIRYVTRIQSAISEGNMAENYRAKTVYGILIADKVQKDQSLSMTVQNNKQFINVISWNSLFIDVQSRYKEFFDILRLKAPDDPRMKGYVELSHE